MFFAGGLNQHLAIYDIVQNKINLVKDMKLSTDIGYYTDASWNDAIITKDERYVVIFIGYNYYYDEESDTEYHDTYGSRIEILDLEKRRLHISKIKLPFEYERLSVILMDLHDLKDIIITGYLRQIDVDKLLPMDIIKVIVSFYQHQFVHLINQVNWKHWKISLDEIIDVHTLSL